MRTKLFVLLATLMALELLLGFYFRNFGDPLFRAWQVLQVDPRLGWIQTQNLNVLFYGKKLLTSSDGFRNAGDLGATEEIDFLTLGPSSALGWGVEQGRTYSDLLKSGHIAFNAAQIGYTSKQGLLLFDRFFAHKKIKNILFAYGINEIDHFRFFDNEMSKSDETFFSQDKLYPEALYPLLRFNIGRLGYRVWLESMFASSCGLTQMPSPRVTTEEIFQNLQGLQKRDPSAKFYVLGTPFALPEGYKERLDSSLSTREMGYLNEADSSDLAGASTLLYEKSVQYNRANRCSDARIAFKLARRFEPFRVLAEVRKLNTAFQAASSRFHYKYIDIQSALGRHLSGGEKVFFDPVHPSEAGHRIIYEEILRSVDNH